MERDEEGLLAESPIFALALVEKWRCGDYMDGCGRCSRAESCHSSYDVDQGVEAVVDMGGYFDTIDANSYELRGSHAQALRQIESL